MLFGILIKRMYNYKNDIFSTYENFRVNSNYLEQRYKFIMSSNIFQHLFKYCNFGKITAVLVNLAFQMNL